MVMIPKKKADAAATAAPAPATTAAPAAAATNTQGPAADATAGDPPAGAPAPAPASAAATTTAIAARTGGAVVVAGRPVNVLQQSYKDAFVVDWNTCHRIQATVGNIVDVEANKAVIGPEITMELLSFQDNWQVSPGTDDDDDIQYVRYSNDGKVTTEGEDIHQYLAALKEAGYKDAKINERCTIAGTMIGTALDGTLVQIDLPPTSKAMWTRFQMQTSMDIAKGKRTEADLALIKLKCNVNTKGKNSWTVVSFDYGV